MFASLTHTRTRLGASALAAAGAMFVLYPAVRPWDDESTVEGATAAMSSSAWVASHLFAMIGFILVPLALLTLRDLLGGGRLPSAAMVTFWIGAGLTLPYYGAEDFGLHAAARESVPNLLDVVDAFRYGSVAVTMFALGLLAMGVGAVLAAVSVWRSGALPRASGIPFAVGFALFLPQFFTPAPVRIAHGALIGLGGAWLAWQLWKAAPAR